MHSAWLPAEAAADVLAPPTTLPSLAASPQNVVDVLLFNPPYVPTEPLEVHVGHGIERAWAGGRDGREVIDALLPHFHAMLTKPTPGIAGSGGVAYMVLVRENRPREVVRLLRERWGLAAVAIASTKARNEALQVLRIEWASEEAAGGAGGSGTAAR